MQVLTRIFFLDDNEADGTSRCNSAIQSYLREFAKETMLTAPRLEDLARAAHLDPHAIVLKSLGAPGPASLNLQVEPDRYLYPASMIKVPLCVAALSLVGDGRLHLEQRFAVTHDNMTANDKPSALIAGYVATLRQIIELTITISDNVGTNMLFDICDRQRATEIVQERYGLPHTEFHRKLSGSEPLIADPKWDGLHRNKHSAGDAALLFELIARDAVPYAGLLREILAQQQFNDKLSAGLREGDVFLHKTGDTDEVTHDGGILQTAEGRAYVVVVYTGLRSSDENNARFSPFMRAVRELL